MDYVITGSAALVVGFVGGLVFSHYWNWDSIRAWIASKISGK